MRRRHEVSMRAFDVVIAATGILVMLPALLSIPVLILLEDGGPVLFRQRRQGKWRKRFEVLKFRTMRDNSVTRVGHFLRATGLDEIPQFINVLRGDMSMVGPRPLTSQDIVRLGWHVEEFDDRWSVLPGITGLAQIYGGHSARVSLFLDRRYIGRKGVGMDFCMILISFGMNLLGKRRVRRWLRRRGGRPDSGMTG